ncbi:MAG: diguanylate cyclase [Micromonosporaceae bacterium]
MRAERLICRSASAVVRPARAAAATIGRWQVWTLSEPLRSYVIALPVLAMAAVAFSVPATRWQATQIIVFVALMACAAIAVEATRTVNEPRGTVFRDLQSVWYLAIAITLPPFYAFAAPIPLTAYKLARVPRMASYRRVFSNATLCLAYGCASWAFHSVSPAFAGPNVGGGVHVLTWTSAVIGCGVLGWVINHVPLFGAIRLSDPAARLRSMVASRESVTNDVVELSLAVSLCLLVAINPVLMTLSLPSLVLHRRHLLHAQLVNKTRIDAKTGLLNAATWQQESEVELARAVRTRTPLAVAVADIDHFKRVNDTLGHLSGDLVLREVAHALRSSLRDYDIIGRFGGEEFTFLLPHTDPAEAARIAERIREHVSQQVITIDDGSRDGFPLRITVSIGVASLTGSHRDLTDLIAAADSALYQAKSAGRNRVHVVADAEGPLPLPN